MNSRESAEPELSEEPFGKIPRDRDALVRQVFDRVAVRYDLMNDLMSGGVHRLWKAAMINWLAPRPGMQFLDLAGGTGDIAFRIYNRLAATTPATYAGRGSLLTVCDINAEMLAVGIQRWQARQSRPFRSGQFRSGPFTRKGLTPADNNSLLWVNGNAEMLPFADSSVDACTIAFGIRNVSDRQKALSEIYRVLTPGGRFLCLEFSTVQNAALAQLYERFSDIVLPKLGDSVAGSRDSYQYLVDSIRQFPGPDDFAATISDAGFRQVRYRLLSGGIAAMHSGWRL